MQPADPAEPDSEPGAVLDRQEVLNRVFGAPRADQIGKGVDPAVLERPSGEEQGPAAVDRVIRPSVCEAVGLEVAEAARGEDQEHH